jgi:5-methylthioribose kinase
MQLHAAACPGSIPRLLHHDPSMAVLLMQFLGPPHQKLLSAIQQGRTLPLLAPQLAQLLLATLVPTSRCAAGEP